MKKLVVIFSLLVLVGCETPADNTASETKEQPKTEKGTQFQNVKTRGVGEPCSGDSDIKCAAGLECRYNLEDISAGGICTDTVVDKAAECPNLQAPVCGTLGRQKNAYLNDCQARRHGVTDFKYGRLCKKDPKSEGSCQAKVMGIGNCEKFFSGVEFDGKACAPAKVYGCDAEIPFVDIAGCEAKCK